MTIRFLPVLAAGLGVALARCRDALRRADDIGGFSDRLRQDIGLAPRHRTSELAERSRFRLPL